MSGPGDWWLKQNAPLHFLTQHSTSTLGSASKSLKKTWPPKKLKHIAAIPPLESYTHLEWRQCTPGTLCSPLSLRENLSSLELSILNEKHNDSVNTWAPGLLQLWIMTDDCTDTFLPCMSSSPQLLDLTMGKILLFFPSAFLLCCEQTTNKLITLFSPTWNIWIKKESTINAGASATETLTATGRESVTLLCLKCKHYFKSYEPLVVFCTNGSPSMLLHLLPSGASFPVFYLAKNYPFILILDLVWSLFCNHQHCIKYLLIQGFHEEVHDFFQVDVECLFYQMKNNITDGGIAPNANDLPSLIDIVSLWFSKFRLEADFWKLKNFHVRKSLVPCSKLGFKLENEIFNIVSSINILACLLVSSWTLKQCQTCWLSPPRGHQMLLCAKFLRPS